MAPLVMQLFTRPEISILQLGTCITGKTQLCSFKGQNPQRFAKQQIRKDQLKNASVRCNVSHKISKRPLGHPSDHVRLRRRLLTALACNLTLPKLHLATFNLKKFLLANCPKVQVNTVQRKNRYLTVNE